MYVLRIPAVVAVCSLHRIKQNNARRPRHRTPSPPHPPQVSEVFVIMILPSHILKRQTWPGQGWLHCTRGKVKKTQLNVDLSISLLCSTLNASPLWLTRSVRESRSAQIPLQVFIRITGGFSFFQTNEGKLPPPPPPPPQHSKASIKTVHCPQLTHTAEIATLLQLYIKIVSVQCAHYEPSPLQYSVRTSVLRTGTRTACACLWHSHAPISECYLQYSNYC